MSRPAPPRLEAPVLPGMTGSPTFGPPNGEAHTVAGGQAPPPAGFGPFPDPSG